MNQITLRASLAWGIASQGAGKSRNTAKMYYNRTVLKQIDLPESATFATVNPSLHTLRCCSVTFTSIPCRLNSTLYRPSVFARTDSWYLTLLSPPSFHGIHTTINVLLCLLISLQNEKKIPIQSLTFYFRSTKLKITL